MTTAVNNPQIVPRQPASSPALRAADEAVADAHELAGHDSPCRDRGVRASP